MELPMQLCHLSLQQKHNKMIAIGVCLILFTAWTECKFNEMNEKYSNIWVAKVRGGEEVAKRVARDLGYTYKGQLGQFEDYYELVKEDHPEISLRDSDHITYSLLELDEVIWAEQQKLMKLGPHVGSLREYTK